MSLCKLTIKLCAYCAYVVNLKCCKPECDWYINNKSLESITINMNIFNPLAEAYANLITSDEDGLLQEISAQTSLKHPKAHMLSGKVQGQFLTFISTFLRPKYILEIGTFTGYSALCLVKGLQPRGELHTIELRESDAETAQSYFNHSNQKNEIHLH